MKKTYIVKTKSDLKTALNNKAVRIVITSSQLAKHVRVVSMASKAMIVTAVAGGTISATQIWNPVGWVSGAVTAGISGTTLVAVMALGLGVASYALSRDYRFEARGSYRDNNGKTLEAEAILERK